MEVVCDVALLNMHDIVNMARMYYTQQDKKDTKTALQMIWIKEYYSKHEHFC